MGSWSTRDGPWLDSTIRFNGHDQRPFPMMFVLVKTVEFVLRHHQGRTVRSSPRSMDGLFPQKVFISQLDRIKTKMNRFRDDAFRGRNHCLIDFVLFLR